jgi:hypothetical protein
LIVGTLLAVSTVMLTQSNPVFAVRSNHPPSKGVKIYFEIQDFGYPLVLLKGGFDITNIVASLDATPHQ